MTPFNHEKYIELQSKAIISRMRDFRNGKLYLEIGGKFLYDEHAERVLPGFNPMDKVTVINSIGKPFDIILAINSKDIESGRIWGPGADYEHALMNLLTNIKLFKLPKPRIAVNLYQDEKLTNRIITRLKYLDYHVYKRFEIPKYPDDLELIVSDEGFGKDEYIDTDNNLVLVISLGSSSGKMSTSMGQIYHDAKLGIESGYAKYELFPIWQLGPDHPVNLAYEAATVDIEDKVIQDPYHLEAKGESATNYNRDVQAFPILLSLIDKIVSPHNQMRAYKSPTQMGINKAGECIDDELLVNAASVIEIKNRLRYYQDHPTDRSPELASKCAEILQKAQSY